MPQGELRDWRVHITRWRTSCLIVAIIGALIAGAVWLRSSSLPPAELVRRAREEFRQGNYKRAEQLADRASSQQGAPATAAIIAGQAAEKQQRFATAIEYYGRVPDDGSAESINSRCNAGDLFLLQLKRLSDAEAQFQRAFAQDELDVRANVRLSLILGVSARGRDAIPFRLRMIKLDAIEALHLYLFCKGDTILENLELLQECHQSDPDDPLPLLGMSRVALDKQDYDSCEALLRRVIAARPDLVEPRVKLGQLLFEHGSEHAFLKWHAAQSHDVESHPDLWLVRGQWAQRHAQPRAAARCFWEAVRIDPNHESANYQLSQALVALEQTEQAEPFLNRSRQLADYFDAVSVAWSSKDLVAIRRAAELAESIGLIWEAYAWSSLTAQHFPGTPWAVRAANRLSARVPELTYQRAIPTANPASHIDLSQLPVPQFPAGGSEPHESLPDNESNLRAHVRFVDRAAETGLIFQYHNRGESEEPTRRMYEFGGGGVAILDFDADGLADIYLTEGTSWPVDTRQTKYLDRLFRNLGDGRFEEVSIPAGIVEGGFSTGVTVGDYNADGFPDLYVANIGGNRFFENNGDGTFTEVTETTGTAGDLWSTSCVLTDLNRDGLPDLYVVNYLESDDVFQRVCPDRQGVTRSCSPRDFDAAPDRIYFNRGDGQFDDVTNRAGIRVPDGKGLGIVAADLSQTGRVDLFVANDAVPNFLFVNQAKNPGDELKLIEQALPAGLAVNAAGRAEACMGIAAGDADGDGLLDLYVTNFFNESNTMFRQQLADQFVDVTLQADLHDPSLKLLGFGTQFIDGNLDGRLDLILTNGHVDDLSDAGTAYQMPCQYFSNVGNGGYVAEPASRLGPYFQGKYLGRGMARVDWNRDGREDVVISHLDSPAALLTNTTEQAGNFVAFRLVGIQSSRDAIGTTLTATIGDDKLTRQLTAGDGYQASNERRIVFGLGDNKQIDMLQLRWPSGTRQQFAEVAAGSELLLIEGRAPLPLP